jgi:hypothetical protein
MAGWLPAPLRTAAYQAKVAPPAIAAMPPKPGATKKGTKKATKKAPAKSAAKKAAKKAKGGRK